MKKHFQICKIYYENSDNQNDSIVIEMKRTTNRTRSIAQTTNVTNSDTVLLVEFDIFSSSHQNQMIFQYSKFTSRMQIDVNHCLIMRIYFTDNRLRLMQNF